MPYFDLQESLGIIAGIIAFASYALYIVSIVRGGSKPNRATWFIWSFVGLIMAISYYFSGAQNTIWVPFVEFLGPFLVAMLSIKYGEGGVHDKTDMLCFLGALMSLVLWAIFDSPVVALVTNLVIDTFALIPTIKKSYLRPLGEDFWAWFGAGTADILNVLAIEHFVFGVVVYPVYMLISDFIIVALLSRAKIRAFGKIKHTLPL